MIFLHEPVVVDSFLNMLVSRNLKRCSAQFLDAKGCSVVLNKHVYTYTYICI